MESISGEESYERASASHVPVGDPAHFPSQFEFGADDKHNWQGRSDERIKLAVMTALHWDLAVPRDRVQVSVHRGWVTLTGRVMRDYEKDTRRSRRAHDARRRRGGESPYLRGWELAQVAFGSNRDRLAGRGRRKTPVSTRLIAPRNATELIGTRLKAPSTASVDRPTRQARPFA